MKPVVYFRPWKSRKSEKTSGKISRRVCKGEMSKAVCSLPVTGYDKRNGDQINISSNLDWGKKGRRGGSCSVLSSNTKRYFGPVIPAIPVSSRDGSSHPRPAPTPWAQQRTVSDAEVGSLVPSTSPCKAMLWSQVISPLAHRCPQPVFSFSIFQHLLPTWRRAVVPRSALLFLAALVR